ncbi:MAG TPA: nucleotidyltransferase domain-containing protein [Bacillota bacterium]|nr:nucleotidyltransferase domain-containing protein [Bacillota bacterium]
MTAPKLLPYNKLRDFFNSRAELTALYIFGSHAAGKAGPLSDIDLAFLVDYSLIDEKNYPYGYQSFLTGEMMKLLGTNDIDVVILNTAPPLLKFQILKNGDILFSRSDAKALEFYVKTFNEYQDIRPLLAVQNMYLSRRLGKKPERDGG